MRKLSIISMIICGLLALSTSMSNATNEPTNNPSTAQTTLSGKVLDSRSGESLAGVEVTIMNTTIKTYTDLDGNFNFNNLPTGTYDVVLSMISYDKSLLDDIKIEKGKKYSC
ncbi:MAG: carboxypeptidase-like regulatory domain-containing protein [Bacteroidales bacterium]|nr:carboxypeptidase-like regulatory domain-containing protein [Bacteroidales bacterium]